MVQGVEAGVTVSRVDQWDDLVAASLADDRLRTELIALFGAIAALLAAVGTYWRRGDVGRSSHPRDGDSRCGGRELRIDRPADRRERRERRRRRRRGRTRPGAARRADFVAVQYGVRITDPIVYAGVGVLLAITTLAATWIPARRATRVRLVDTLAADS